VNSTQDIKEPERAKARISHPAMDRTNLLPEVNRPRQPNREEAVRERLLRIKPQRQRHLIRHLRLHQHLRQRTAESE